MVTIDVFPDECKYLVAWVKNVLVIDDLLGGDGNADVFMRMKDGQSYSFTAFTPDNAKSLMLEGDESALISPGLILVRRMSLEAILEALEACLRFQQEYGIPLTHFGTLQSYSPEAT